MVMMGLAKMKQTIQMEMNLLDMSRYVAQCERVLSVSWITWSWLHDIKKTCSWVMLIMGFKLIRKERQITGTKWKKLWGLYLCKCWFVSHRQKKDYMEMRRKKTGVLWVQLCCGTDRKYAHCWAKPVKYQTGVQQKSKYHKQDAECPEYYYCRQRGEQ